MFWAIFLSRSSARAASISACTGRRIAGGLVPGVLLGAAVFGGGTGPAAEGSDWRVGRTRANVIGTVPADHMARANDTDHAEVTDSPATDAALSFDPAPLAVQAYLDILAAPTAEAGSGSAACLVLAMAFGCLEKAAALTFKHHPERTEMSAVIAQLARLRRQSLDAAADEATCFAEFTRESSATKCFSPLRLAPNAQR